MVMENGEGEGEDIEGEKGRTRGERRGGISNAGLQFFRKNLGFW